jgi:molybdate transport system permease protein
MVLAWLRAFGEFGATVVLAYHPETLPVFSYVQFTSTGIPATEAPVVLGLAAAAVVAFFGGLPRRRRRRRHRPALPEASVPRPAAPTPVSWDLHIRLGTFLLDNAHDGQRPTLAILGASGAGKSALLRGLAGLLGPGAGHVGYGDHRVDGVPVEERRVGYVPQGYGLFPHLTVWEQVIFGTGADRGLAVYWLDRLGLAGLEWRFPDELSGGQRQRVALAQALARAPDLLLLDEPFSALDSPVRRELRAELRRLQRETAVSTVLVTHDPAEAAFLAEEVVVLEDGRVLQAGTKAEVFLRPASPEVARLIGLRNLHTGQVVEDGTVASGGLVLVADTGGLPVGTEVRWCVSPEQVGLATVGDHPAIVRDLVDLATSTELVVEVGCSVELEVVVPGRLSLPVGAPCTVTVPAAAIRVWPSAR